MERLTRATAGQANSIPFSGSLANHHRFDLQNVGQLADRFGVVADAESKYPIPTPGIITDREY